MRLTAHVYEDPSSLQYLTCYGYDALDDLTQVQHQGATASPDAGCTAPLQTRAFGYNALKRLTSATNPESGTIYYGYDGNGNMTSRVDANGITSTFQYDKLNRVGSRHYSANSTGDIALCYDGDTAATHGGSPDWSCAGAPSGTASLLVGRLTMVTSPASTTQYSQYDSWGRVLSSRQTTQGVSYPFSYTYDATGDLLTETYPTTSRKITYTYDNIGRAATVSGVLGGLGTSYASIATPPNSGYAAQGAIQQMTLGALVEQTCFNARLQPIVKRQLSGTPSPTVCGSLGTDVLRLSFGYNGSNNNGNIASQTIAYPTAMFNQSYIYDNVNRLSTAGETGPGTPWSQTYGYGYAGNRWVSGFTLSSFTPMASSNFDSGNRLQMQNSGYDTAGNQTQIGGYSFGYDAENRMVSSTIGGGTSTNSYDGEGRRVMKQSGTTTTVYVYDAQGGLTQEYATGTVSLPPCTTCYLMADHLGSTRLMVDGSGNPVASAKHDYLPFGEEIPPGVDGRDSSWGGVELTQKFTGKERDAETGLDYFGARYFSSAQGRFTSPDWSAKPQGVPYADLKDPQTLNLYAYVRNNPLNRTDPDGHICIFGFGNTCTPSPAQTATQGAATGTGAQLLNDGIRRGQYQAAASQLSGRGGSAARTALQADTYTKLSPIGQGMTDAAKLARAGQLAGKTAEELGESASRTSATWNAIGGASKVVGTAGVVVGIGLAASNIASAPEGQRGQVAAGQVGSLSGGLAVGYGGAWVGGVIGSFIEPGGGTAVGAFIGGLLGGGGGSVAGEKVGTVVYKKLEDQ